MGILARKLLLEHKDNLLKYTSIYETYLREDTDNPFWLVTTNKLLNTYEGMDGLKTGYTSESGYNLTATAKRDNLRFIAIVMGGSSSKSRNADITTLLNYGFNKYKSVTLYKNGETLKEVTFSNAKDNSSQIITNEDINVVIEKNQNLDNVNINIEIFKSDAPISKEEIIGKLKIKGQDGTLIAEYNLYVKEDVPKLSFWDHFLHFFKKII
jgi:D-alanyl-D-alanine carboxypeptidase (penicillin-binding protein 5/6)